MASRARWVLAAAASSLALTACLPNRFVTGWVPYWGPSSGKAVIDNDDSAALMGEVSMMWYGTAANGSVPLMSSATNLASVVASTRAQGLAVIPTVFDSQPAGVMRGILHDPFARAVHEQFLVDLVMSKGYDGIDIDYEVFAFGDGRTKWDAIRPDWIAFVQELGSLLHQRGKLLSVTVPPVWVSGGVTQGYTVYAQEEIAPHVDRLRLMVYDWSTSLPGPISPISWVNQVIAWSDSRVPNSRLQLGVPAYGRHWATRKNPTETCPAGALWRDSITMKETAGLAAAHGATPTRHSSGELTFSWTEQVTGPVEASPPTTTTTSPATTIESVDDGIEPGGLDPPIRVAPPPAIVTCTVEHIVYVPDGVSVRQRADAALAAGWSGIAIWAYGYETADVYQQLAGVAPQRPNGDPTGVLDTPTVVNGALRVTGMAVDPEFDLPVAVSLTVAPTGLAPTQWRVVTARAERDGMAAGLGPFHGFDETFPAAPGSYDVCATVVLWGGATGPSLGCQTVVVSAPL